MDLQSSTRNELSRTKKWVGLGLRKILQAETVYAATSRRLGPKRDTFFCSGRRSRPELIIYILYCLHDVLHSTSINFNIWYLASQNNPGLFSARFFHFTQRCVEWALNFIEIGGEVAILKNYFILCTCTHISETSKRLLKLIYYYLHNVPNP